MPTHIKPYIICVDDEKVVLDTLATQIEESPLADHFQLERAQSGAEALDLIDSLLEDKEKLAVVVSDQTMPQMMGDELLARVHQVSPDTQNILLTGHARMDSVISAINTGKIYRYLTKPWEKNDLVMTIESAGSCYINKIEHDERNRLLAKLYEASMLLNASVRADELMESVMKLLNRYTEATSGALMLLGHHGLKKAKTFQKVAAPVPVMINGVVSNQLPNADQIVYDSFDVFGGSFPLPKSLFDHLSKTKKAYYNNLVTSHSLGDELSDDPYWEESRPRSLVAIPLVTNNEMIGLAYLEHMSRYNAFPEDVEHFLEHLAPTVSIAFSNAVMYESLAEQNKHTTDSIKATKRIQNAMMPPQKSVKNLFKECEILFKPKDIVSGDFYWVKRIQ